MIALIMDVEPHNQPFDGVLPSWSGAVPPGDLAPVRPCVPAGAQPTRLGSVGMLGKPLGRCLEGVFVLRLSDADPPA